MEELSIDEIKQKLLTPSAKGAISKTATQIKRMNENNARVELEKYFVPRANAFKATLRQGQSLVSFLEIEHSRVILGIYQQIISCFVQISAPYEL